MKSELMRIYNQDVDVLIVLLLMLRFSDSMILFGIFITYSLIRFYSLHHLVLMFFLNYITFAAIASNSMNFTYGSGKSSTIIFMIILFFLILILSQAYTILFKAFSSKLTLPPFVEKWQLKFLNSFIFIFDFVYYLISAILAIIYPVIVSLMIIIVFAGTYNSINHYHQQTDEEIGIFYSENETRLSSVQKGKTGFGLENIKYLIENDYVYFSSTTFYTIGYGDIVPKGTISKMMVTVQMIVSNVLGIGIFALYGTLFYNFINDKKTIRLGEKSPKMKNRSSIV